MRGKYARRREACRKVPTAPERAIAEAFARKLTTTRQQRMIKMVEDLMNNAIEAHVQALEAAIFSEVVVSSSGGSGIVGPHMRKAGDPPRPLPMFLMKEFHV